MTTLIGVCTTVHFSSTHKSTVSFMVSQVEKWSGLNISSAVKVDVISSQSMLLLLQTS